MAINEDGYQTNAFQMSMGSIAGGQGQLYGWMWAVTRLSKVVILMNAFTCSLEHVFARLLVHAFARSLVCAFARLVYVDLYTR